MENHFDPINRCWCCFFVFSFLHTISVTKKANRATSEFRVVRCCEEGEERISWKREKGGRNLGNMTDDTVLRNGVTTNGSGIARTNGRNDGTVAAPADYYIKQTHLDSVSGMFCAIFVRFRVPSTDPISVTRHLNISALHNFLVLFRRCHWSHQTVQQQWGGCGGRAWWQTGALWAPLQSICLQMRSESNHRQGHGELGHALVIHFFCFCSSFVCSRLNAIFAASLNKSTETHIERYTRFITCGIWSNHHRRKRPRSSTPRHLDTSVRWFAIRKQNTRWNEKNVRAAVRDAGWQLDVEPWILSEIYSNYVYIAGYFIARVSPFIRIRSTMQHISMMKEHNNVICLSATYTCTYRILIDVFHRVPQNQVDINMRPFVFLC